MPSVELVRFDSADVSLGATTALARIQFDGFKNDVVRHHFWPDEAQFAPHKMPAIADFEALQERVAMLGRLVRSEGRKWWLDMRRDPRKVLFLLKADGQYVAGALWRQPEFAPTAPAPWYSRLWVWLAAQAFRVADFLAFGGRSPVAKSGLYDEFDRVGALCGYLKTPEICQELADMPPKKLREVNYPKAWSYYVETLVVREDAHGHGYGKRVLLDSQEQLRIGAVAPPGLRGPPKATLMSSPVAYDFYARIGYTPTARVDEELPNGVPVSRAYFFHNLD